jgi:hypothetical protein
MRQRKTTVVMIELLLRVGWELRFVNNHFEWRNPQGICGSDFQTDTLYQFPQGVSDWIDKDLGESTQKL